MSARAWITLAVIAFALGCVDSKSSATDTARRGMRQDSATRVDMIQLDSMAASPAPRVQAPPAARPREVIGESRRDETPTARQPELGDPMPPLAGETNMRHGTMKPAEPVLRDSASGPRMRIDSKGNVTPIKK